MVKIAHSAEIKQYKPTRPREGSSHTILASEITAGGALMRVLSFVFPVGIFRVFEVPQGATAADLWNRREVVSGRRRAGRPLQSPCIPRIASRSLAMEIRPK